MSPVGSAASLPAHEGAIWIHNKAAPMLLSFSASVDGALSLLDVMSVLNQRSLNSHRCVFQRAGGGPILSL